MKTEWRGNGEVPHSYDPVGIGRVGERIRDEIVDFDWPLTLKEFKQLRRAAYTWGRRTVRQFKKFDAQVVDAINGMARPPAPGMYKDFKIPDGCEDVDSAVEVVEEEDCYRLVGHTSFAVIVGYGFGGAGRALYRDDGKARTYREALGEELAHKLESALLSLGWSAKQLWDSNLEDVVDRKIYKSRT